MAQQFSPEIWTGRWQWLPERAFYSDPARQIESQTAEVRVVGNDFWINQRFVHRDGLSMSWTWDGAFDGVARPIRWDHDGSEMIDITFYFTQGNFGGDSYATRDQKKFGSEVYRLTHGKLEVWGCYTLLDGDEVRQWPYREEWQKVG